MGQVSLLFSPYTQGNGDLERFAGPGDAQLESWSQAAGTVAPSTQFIVQGGPVLSQPAISLSIAFKNRSLVRFHPSLGKRAWEFC